MATKKRIGIVGLDTSHPDAWIPILRDMGYDVAGIYDDGAIRSRFYTEAFANKFNFNLYEDIHGLVNEVDSGIIHSCNWDKHIVYAEQFVDQGKSVFIDKPIAGNYHDLQTIAGWVKDGARILGGSSLYFCDEVQEARALTKETGRIHTVLAGCGVDEFNYGIHAYSLACGVFGGGLKSVQCLGENLQKQIRLEWKDGRVAILIVGGSGIWLPFHATFITGKKVTQVVVDVSRIYRSLLEIVMPYLAGETDISPVDIEVLIEAEKAALAAKYSIENGNKQVDLELLASLNVSYDGSKFAGTYRKLQRA